MGGPLIALLAPFGMAMIVFCVLGLQEALVALRFNRWAGHRGRRSAKGRRGGAGRRWVRRRWRAGRLRENAVDRLIFRSLQSFLKTERRRRLNWVSSCTLWDERGPVALAVAKLQNWKRMSKKRLGNFEDAQRVSTMTFGSLL